ncbi:MAG: wax ester/triacylglycerol synthase family O-acyltransferase [Pseudomonadales bacterium]
MLKQLSAQDASFAFMETKASPMHIGSCYVYDRGAAANPRIAEDQIMRFYEERLHLWTFARQRLIRVPFDVDYPYWIEDSDFDLEYHIRRIALPSPGDLETLKQITARIFSRPLDFSRPLWEVYIIEGVHLPGEIEDGFAVLTKTHHAAVDGTSGMHLMATLHDPVPEPQPVPRPERPWRPDPTPSDVELMVRSGFNNFVQPFRFAQTVARSVSSIKLPTADLLGGGDKAGGSQALRVVPKTRFNGQVTGHRVVGGHEFALEELKAVRAAVPGATVNDAILAICGGALRRYLSAKVELPGDSMIAMAPVNVRKKGDMSAGNQVSALFVPVGSEIADPLERLAAVYAATSVSKEVNNAVGARLMTDYSQFVPAITAAQAGRLSATLAQAPNPPFNLTITNVPGPQQPIFSMGCELKTQIGLGPISHGMGLIMPVTSYCGRLMLGFTSCREMIPDPDFFTECLADSVTEMVAVSVEALQ